MRRRRAQAQATLIRRLALGPPLAIAALLCEKAALVLSTGGVQFRTN